VRDLPQQIQRRAQAKLVAIDANSLLDDLRIPPGNRLEALHGDRRGQFSIRVNDQWRICFTWRNNEAWDVEIVDYH
jgi:proteic killer suppression protein